MLVTAAIAVVKPYVPVLSLGVVYVFAVLPVAVVWGLAYAIPVSVASMLAFNWLYLPPTHTFALRDGANWFALAVYLVTALALVRAPWRIYAALAMAPVYIAWKLSVYARSIVGNRSTTWVRTARV